MPEKEKVPHRACSVVERPRNVLFSLFTTGLSIRNSEDNDLATVSKQCLLSLLSIIASDERQASLQFLFMINNDVLNFFTFLHEGVRHF